jgi:hypothetical protein
MGYGELRRNFRLAFLEAPTIPAIQDKLAGAIQYRFSAI